MGKELLTLLGAVPEKGNESYVYIGKGVLRLTDGGSSDLSIGRDGIFPGKWLVEGAVVQGRLLQQALKALPEPEVHLEGGEMILRQEGGEVRLYTASEPPLLADPPSEEGGFLVEGESLLKAIETVAYAVSTESFRGVFRGLFADLKSEGILRLVASDGYRLALVDLERQGEKGPQEGFIFPLSPGLKAFLRMAREGEVRILPQKGGVYFVTEWGWAFQRLIEGDYPDYSRVIPQNPPYGATLNIRSLFRAIEGTEPLLDTNHKILLRLEEGGAVLEGEGDLGKARFPIPIEEPKLPPQGVDLYYNLTYLREAVEGLERWGEEKVRLEFFSPETPTLVRGIKGDHIAVIVPLKIG